MNKVQRIITIIAICLLFTCFSETSAEAAKDPSSLPSPPVRLVLLDDFSMTSEPIWGPLTPGQLSGLTYDAASQTFLAISDDRFDPASKQSRDHPRYYTLTLPLTRDAKTGKISISFADTFHFTYLKEKRGNPLPFERGDGEGIVMLPNGNIAIATEGHAERKRKVDGRPLVVTAPSVDEFYRDGIWKRSYPIPSYYCPRFNHQGQQIFGVVHNNGFESLTRVHDTLFAATEGALIQDGGPATFEKGGLIRILEMKQKRNGSYTPLREYVYPLDPIILPASWGTLKPEHSENGVSELIALDEYTLLVLERAFLPRPYFRNYIRIYQVDLRHATNTLGQRTLSDNIRPLQKRLVVERGIEKGSRDFENYEAMAFVDLPDGGRGLVIASDNNHKHPNQRQTLLLYRLEK